MAQLHNPSSTAIPADIGAIMTAVAALLIISVVAIVIINIKKRSQKRLISAACKEIFEDITSLRTS
jgi:hypothetical protein